MQLQSTRVPRICATCGAEFLAYPSRVKAGEARFCSNKCYTRVLVSPEERFWSRVKKTDNCWIWIGDKTPEGYGRLRVCGKSVLTHRYSYELHHGPIPEDKFVLHSCPEGDRPDCVNPEHLRLGTHIDNMRDMRERGRAATGIRHGSQTHPERVPRGDQNGARTKPERHARGSRVGNSKLTEADIQVIRSSFIPFVVTRNQLAKRFGVSKSLIDQILSGVIWKHVNELPQPDPGGQYELPELSL